MFTVYKEDTPVITPTRLKLVDNANGTVSIVVVDERGYKKMSGHIGTFQKDGCFRLSTGVAEGLGLKLDGGSSIKTE